MFGGIRAVLEALDVDVWPTLDQLNALSEARALRNASGAPICFVAPTMVGSAMAYESQIAASGEIPTRENLHDLLNALQWLSFPRMKGTINAEHVKRLQEGGEAEAKSRSRERDVLTMFDESGVIVASADRTLLDLLQTFQWRALFVDRRADVTANMRFYLVGHGLMEKALAPFIGITGKAVLLNVEADEIGATSMLDGAIAQWLAHPAHLASAQNLAPLPLLGIPGWDARNEDAAFYDNATYFRPGRLPKPA